MDGVIFGATLVTFSKDEGFGRIENSALAWKDGRIAYVGPRDGLPDSAQHAVRQIEFNGLITPGLIDCHTHAVFAANRAHEFELRLKGASYEEVAQAGGGIVSSVKALHAASYEELLEQSLPRVYDLIADGVTTLEIKSGYGLDLENERKMLRCARAIAKRTGATVKTTFLAAHALPEAFAGRADDYIEAAISWMLELHAEGLIDAVDAFVERIGFTPAQGERMLSAARTLGLPVKLHADQLSDGNGAALAAKFGALSADHIEYTSESGVLAMKEAGTVAVLLPGAFHVLRETRLPPIDLLRKHKVPMAIATDLNPGTSPLRSMRQAMQLACTHFKMTPEEVLRGATVNAARALGLEDRGRLVEGLRADFSCWRAHQPAELAYWLGGRLCAATFKAGVRLEIE